ncbi:MAG TPA: phage major capsid protein, P2 family [Allosphingosinicella sp.]|jgi:P2 family phage major capsid protein
MLNSTRVHFNSLMSRIGELNGVEDVSKQFSVEPSVEQKLEARVQESSAFLSEINVYPVPELKGEKIGMGVTSRIASRTDTSGAGVRKARNPMNLTGRGFELAKTDFDTFISYGQLDLWAKFPNFQTMYGNVVAEAIALDRIAIGFNGTSVAANSDDVANPDLEDVNKGWLQYIREEAANHVFSDGAHAVNKIRVGADEATTDYRTLDALVYDAIHSFMPTWGRKRTDLVAIVGGGLLHDKYFTLINEKQDPSEQVARDVIMSTKRMGGRQAAEVPYVPDGTILVTPFKNLSIYYQDGKRRRFIQEEPVKNRIVDYQSSNEGYVVEDLDPVVLIENIELVDGAA